MLNKGLKDAHTLLGMGVWVRVPTTLASRYLWEPQNRTGITRWTVTVGFPSMLTSEPVRVVLISCLNCLSLVAPTHLPNGMDVTSCQIWNLRSSHKAKNLIFDECYYSIIWHFCQPLRKPRPTNWTITPEMATSLMFAVRTMSVNRSLF